MRRAVIPSRALLLGNPPVSGKTVRSEPRDLDRCERSERRSASPPRATQPGFGEEPRSPWILMDQTTGAARPGLPFLSRTNRLRAEGGGLARRPERCNPGYRPGGERSGAAAKLCPLNDGGENHVWSDPRDLDRCERSERRSASLSGATTHSRGEVRDSPTWIGPTTGARCAPGLARFLPSVKDQ